MPTRLLASQISDLKSQIAHSAMPRPRNMVVAQSGGPSPVINNSLRGIVETARELAEIGTVYGARHGIEGVLKEELLDLSVQPAEEIALLRVTPAAGSIGTCRYKLKPAQTEDFERVIGGLPSPRCTAISSTSAATIRWTPPTKWPLWRRRRVWTWWRSACPRRSTTTWETASLS